LVLAAFLVRLYEGRFHPLVASDGISFIGLAQNIFSEYYGDTFRSLLHHPFYPLLINIFSKFSSYESGGVAVSLILGSLLVIPVFLLGHRFYGDQVAYISSFLIIFDRTLVNFSAEILNETTYLFLLFMGICLGWLALERKRLLLYAAASLFLTLSYLTRPEGAAALAILLIWVMVSIKFFHHLPWKRATTALIIMVMIFAITSSPYLVFLHHKLGRWTLSGKLYRLQAYGLRDSYQDWQTLTDNGKRVFSEAVYDPHSEVAQEIEEKGEPSLLTNIKRGRVEKHLKAALDIMMSMAFPWIVALVILGLFRRGWDKVRLGKELYLATFFSFTPFLYSFIFVPNARHLIAVLPIIAIWAGKGIEEFSSWFSESIKKFSYHLSLAGEKKAMAAITLIVLLPSILFIFNPRREMPSMAAKEAGLWIKNNLPAKPVIMSTNSRVSYYAESGVPVFSPYAEDLSKTLDYASYNKVEYIIVDEESTSRLTPQLSFLLDESKAPRDKLEFVYKYAKDSGHKILVYRLLNEKR
jgi:hypothetical protein